MAINRAILTGRLTKDPSLKTTQSGLAVVTFTLAVDRATKNKQTGQRDADYINCVAWRKTAELIGQYTAKGSLIGVDGRIQTRHYQAQDGHEVYVTEVLVDNVSFLQSKGNGNNSQNNARSGFNNQTNINRQTPNSNTSATQNINPMDMPGDTIDISDDDLPF